MVHFYHHNHGLPCISSVACDCISSTLVVVYHQKRRCLCISSRRGVYAVSFPGDSSGFSTLWMTRYCFALGDLSTMLEMTVVFSYKTNARKGKGKRLSLPFVVLYLRLFFLLFLFRFCQNTNDNEDYCCNQQGYCDNPHKDISTEGVNHHYGTQSEGNKGEDKVENRILFTWAVEI